MEPINHKLPQEFNDTDQTKGMPISPLEINNANCAIWDLFSNCLPTKGTEEIAITGQVLADGRGDWAAMRKYQKYLQKMFPDRAVRIIASSATNWEGLLDISKKELEPSTITYYCNASLGGIDVPLSNFPSEAKIVERVLQAGVVIEAGVSIASTFPDEFFSDINRESIKIYEHDFKTTSSKSFGNVVFQTGVNPANAGILLNSNKKVYQWQDLENVNLKSILFGNNDPQTEQVNDYLSKRTCFFCYMKEQSNKINFIGAAVSFATANSNEKSIDICIPNIVMKRDAGLSDSKIQEITTLISAKKGIDQVKIIWFDGDKKLEHTIDLREDDNQVIGRELTVIDPGNLIAKDFKILVDLSAPLLGCTGDSSLAEAISFKKIPCYEPTRHRSKFMALLTRIGEDIGCDSALYKYCENPLQKRARFVEVADPRLAGEAARLGEIIREKSSFKPILKGVVNEKLLRKKDKDFADKEDLIRQNYYHKIITLEELTSQISVLLKERGMF